MCAYVVACDRARVQQRGRRGARRDGRKEKREPVVAPLSLLFVDRPVVGRSVATYGAHGPRQQKGMMVYYAGRFSSLGRPLTSAHHHNTRCSAVLLVGLVVAVRERASRMAATASSSTKHDDALPVPLLRREEISHKRILSCFLSLAVGERRERDQSLVDSETRSAARETPP